MKPGKYGIKELFKDRNVEKILVPEIQRDYVWGTDQVLGLLDSIVNEYDKFKNAIYALEGTSDDELLNKAFEDFYKKQKHVTSIGFIYAYDDPGYPGNYFLIDGQQRLTTCYLLLAALAVQASRTDEFRRTYFPNRRLKLDYKVRESAHDFFSSFIDFILMGKQPDLVKKQNWYYEDYKNDLTINSIYNNYQTISHAIASHTASGLFDYVQDYVEFWYFDTNISEQGEELYIYMNARGEQMQSNENLKASLLAKENGESLKNTAGKEWEDWQDFFWQNRGENENADQGFNEFLNSIAGIENYQLATNQLVILKDKFDKSGISSKTLLNYLDLTTIKLYFSAFQRVLSAVHKCGLYYQYYDWARHFQDDWWDVFNNNKTNWFADLDDANRGLEHSRMVFIWSLLSYFVNNECDDLEAIRIIRLYFVRYYNYDRQVKAIRSRVDFYAQNSIFSDDIREYSNDEVLKHRFYVSHKEEKIELYEQLIWKIEDHKYNLEGAGLDAVNISHLVSFEDHPTLEKLSLIATRFYDLFPNHDGEQEFPVADNLRTILFYYGAYWHRVSPWYYENYDCSNWRRIIRDHDSKVEAPFRTFFQEYLKWSLSQIKHKCIQNFFAKHGKNIGGTDNILPDMPLVERLIIYSLLLPDLWEKGGSIAVYDPISRPRLFENELNKIYNTRGNFKGGSNYVDLWDKVRKTYKSKSNTIEALKEMAAAVSKELTV